jgi:signal transduction histidine kinase
VPAKVRDEIFDFGFSTVREGEYGEDDDQVPGDQHVLSGIDRNVLRTSPMAGLGFGLPMSRLYAQYFGGDVSFSSMEGYGSDVLV